MARKLAHRRVVIGTAVALSGLGIGALAATANTPSRRALMHELQRPALAAPVPAAGGLVAMRRVRSGYSVALQLSPNRAAHPNRLLVRLAGPRRPSAQAKVAMSFSMPSMDMWGAYTVTLKPLGHGRYVAMVPVLGMAGDWRLSTTVTAPGTRAARMSVTDPMSA